MNTALLVLLISAALTANLGKSDAAPSAELARLILQALEMSDANAEQRPMSAVSRQEEDQKADNPYKDFKPPEDHKLPTSSNAQQSVQGTTANGQFSFPSISTIVSAGGTLVSVEKIFTPDGK